MRTQRDPLKKAAGFTEIGQSLFDDVAARFINPEVARRREAGLLGEGDLIYRFQILFREDEGPTIRLNTEVGGTVTATAARSLKAGEEVTVSDIAGISSYEARPDDAGVPHVTGFAHREGWSLVFEFAQGHPSRGDFLSRAGEFLSTAHDALHAERLGPFLDNAFSACELLAKAELLSCRPTVELVLNSKKHGAVAVPYNLWANLGNTDKRFARLLVRLTELRGPARYLDKELELEHSEGLEIMALLDEMQNHVARQVESRFDNGNDVYYAYATRAVRAGELIGPGDFTLIPPRKPH